MLRKKLSKALRRIRGNGGPSFGFLDSQVFELNTIGELKKVFRWDRDAILRDPSIHEFEYVEDVNERRVRDAETLGTVCRNVNAGVMLEIGTAEGHSTALMSENAPGAKIHTVNILPEEMQNGEGGNHTTIALERDKIGSYYRERGCGNITQIFANSAVWEPDLGTIDVAFIDGCHDVDFVYNDSVKILRHMKPGAFMLWHDFNPALTMQYHWINSVCRGIELLFETGKIDGRIFHVKDSWTGVYRVE